MEIEAKFQISDEEALQRLLETGTLARFTLGKVSIAELHDRYLDTKDGAIRAGGYAYRIRQTDRITLATLKGLGGVSGAVHRRAEHQVELPEPQPPQAWPSGAARDTMLRLCDTEELTAMFEVKQTRYSRPLYDGDRLVAEVSLDRVRISREDMAASFLELEAELVADGREEDLEQISTELQELWELAPESRSKYDRGLALHKGGTTGPEAVFQVPLAGQAPPTPAMENSTVGRMPATVGESSTEGASAITIEVSGVEGRQTHLEQIRLVEQPGIEPKDPMGEAGRKTLRFHFQRMVDNEPGTRLGADIEALHQMRVATRRMRAAFRIFGPYYEAEAIAPYLEGLKQTGRALGAVRDLDVFRATVQAYLDNLPESQRDSLDDLLALLERQRDAARAQMLAHLDGNQYRCFVDQFGTFVETFGMGSLGADPGGNDPRPYRVRHVAPVTIYQRLANVRAYDEWVCIPDPPPARLHALRIACKRLRYTLEFFQEVLGPDTGTIIEEVVAMQDHLGALQDTVVASSILRDYLCRGTWGQQTIPAQLSDPAEAIVSPGVTAYLTAQQARCSAYWTHFPGHGRSLQEQVSAS